MTKNPIVRFASAARKWIGYDAVIRDLGLGTQTTKVRLEEHPGSVWAVETGGTILMDVTNSPNSEQTLDRLCKLRRSILVRTAVFMAIGILTIVQLVNMSDFVLFFLLASGVSAMFLTQVVAKHEEARQHVLVISTTMEKRSPDLSKETVEAGSLLMATLRQLATHEALLPSEVKRGLLAGANKHLRQEMPHPSADTLNEVNEAVREALKQRA